MDQEKQEWMDEVGIKEIDKPLKYISRTTGMMYSEEYIKETPLHVLKAKFEKFRDLENQVKHDGTISEGNYESL